MYLKGPQTSISTSHTHRCIHLQCDIKPHFTSPSIFFRLSQNNNCMQSLFQQKLTELRQWSEKVRNFDKSFVTENGLLYVDCSAIHEGLLPRLDDVYQELITFVSDEARNLARSFCEEMVTVIQVGLVAVCTCRFCLAEISLAEGPKQLASLPLC